MAYDYMTRVPLNRAVTDIERSRRVDVHKPVADEAADAYTVFGMNDRYLEICDASYFQLGWCLLAFLVGFPGFLLLTIAATQAATEVNPIMVQNGDQGWFSASMWFMSALMLAGCAFSIVLLRRDCFNYRHRSVRFNRRTRTVYAFKHNGRNGVIQVPWDKAFFYVQRQASNSAFGGAPTLMRCLVLNDAGEVVDTFSFGLRTVNGASESSDYGRQVLYQVKANFEFIRRYMEDGPTALPPVSEYLPREPSLRNSIRVRFYGLGAIGRVGMGLRIFTFMISGPVFLLSVLHYIAQLTSREPVWPTDVETACGNTEPATLVRA
ncbi:DUF6708 domain-containing protein [Paraburkholderia graminis]|jgi:hypothetical protein|uniref:DUF6708 domain-containing protein n=1 Tax=Paraburkholderia graminis TaxID=60548 RepID=A0ABD5CAF4_9BURK|nr:DUF6708 domain-containing protein [Paraburkholderia graminis]MDR6202018.1 hypothetical protein [Paraburkholderia graminis]